MQLRRGVMVNHSNPSPAVRVQNRSVHLNQRSVTPQRELTPLKNIHSSRHLWEKIIPAPVSQVARTNFCSHVPSVKRGGGVSDPTNL
jgi:hypothetical protein